MGRDLGHWIKRGLVLHELSTVYVMYRQLWNQLTGAPWLSMTPGTHEGKKKELTGKLAE